MTITEIKEILTTEFENAEDRKYWKDKLEAEEQKERRSKENDIYFKKNAKYDR